MVSAVSYSDGRHTYTVRRKGGDAVRELYGVYQDRKHLTPKRTTEPSLWRWYWTQEQAEAALAAAAQAFGWRKIEPRE